MRRLVLSIAVTLTFGCAIDFAQSENAGADRLFGSSPAASPISTVHL